MQTLKMINLRLDGDQATATFDVKVGSKTLRFEETVPATAKSYDLIAAAGFSAFQSTLAELGSIAERLRNRIEESSKD